MARGRFGLVAGAIWFAASAGLAIGPSAALAQPTPGGGVAPRTAGVITGRIKGADGIPVDGAVISLIGTTDTALANDSGHFALHDVPARSYVLAVRKVGYQPVRRLISVDGSTPIDLALALTPSVHTLSTVVTVSSMGAAYRRIGFDVRMRSGIGQFLTDDQIQHREATRLSQLLETFRGYHMNAQAYADPALRGTGNRNNESCMGLLIDGVRQPNSTMQDADEIVPVEAIGALEFYRPSEVPPEWADASVSHDSIPQVRQRFQPHPQGQVDSVSQVQTATPAPACSVAVVWTHTRLGISTVETQTDRSVVLETSRGHFAPSGARACELSAANDTVAFVVYGVLEGTPGAGGHDARWSRYADSVLHAIRHAFALPTEVPLPVFGFPFRPVAGTESGTAAAAGQAAPTGPQVAPAPSGVIVLTVDSSGSLVEAHVAASSLSGASDTAMLAAIQGASAAHALPPFPAAVNGGHLRLDLAFSTVSPAGEDRSLALGQIETPVWTLDRGAVIDSTSQPSLRAPGGAPASHDSAMLEFVVDAQGRAVVKTARALGGSGAERDAAAYRAFLNRVVRALPQVTFKPATVATCAVPQLVFQPFVDR